MEDENFRQKLSDRWQELRRGPFETTKILTSFDSVASVLKEDRAQERNFQRWPVLGEYVWPNYYVGNTFQEEVEWLKSWISQRASWLDTQIPMLTTGLEQDTKEDPYLLSLFLQYSLDKPGKVLVSWYEIQGRKITSEEIDHSGKGLQTIGINTRSIPTGIPLIKVRFQDGTIVTKKVVKF